MPARPNRLLVFSAALATFIGVIGAAVAQSRVVSVPSKPLAAALQDFSAQTGVPVLASPDLLAGKRSGSVDAIRDHAVALNQILRGTGLKFRREGRTFLIERVPQPVRVAARPTSADTKPPSLETLDEVLVTGSRIYRSSFAAPTPTTILTGDQIRDASPVIVSEYINLFPQLSATKTSRSQNATTSRGSNGINAFNLRALGTTRTLALVDGKRAPSSAVEGVVDVNTLPAAFLERVEIVTGGASAAYGSDAVAGVVNLIVDHRFEGLRGRVSGGATSVGDNATLIAELAWGGSFDAGRGHVQASAEYSDIQGVDVLDPSKRAWFKSYNMLVLPEPERPQRIIAAGVNLYRVAKGGLVTSGPLANTQFGPGGEPLPFVVGSPHDAVYMVGGNSWSEGGAVALNSALTRRVFSAAARYDVSDKLSLSIDGWVGDSVTRGGATYQRYPGAGSTALIVRADNPFLDARFRDAAAALGVETFTYGYSSFDLGHSVNLAQRRVHRVVASIDATTANGWRLNAYYQAGGADITSELRNTTNSNRFQQAIDATRNAQGTIVCRSTLTDPDDGCVPLNIFGVGVASPEGIAYVKGASWQRLVFTQEVLAASVDGEIAGLGAGPARGAFGGEYRREGISGNTDAISAANGFFTGNFRSANGAYEVRELFAEFVAPLVKGANSAPAADFNAAARYTSYSQAGEVITWKAGVTYDIATDFRLRAVASRDIRAPNVGELFTDGATSRTDVIDTSMPSRPNVSVTRVTSGNRDLSPEVADTHSLGVIYQPSSVGLTASLDFYSIAIDDALSIPSNQQIVDRCQQGETQLCKFIERNAAGTITRLNVRPENLEAQVLRGVDLEVGFQKALAGDSAVALRGLVSKVLDAHTENGGVRTDIAGQNAGALATPDWRWMASATYSAGRASLTANVRGVSAGVYDNAWVSGVDIDENRIEGATYYDLYASYRLTDDTRGGVTAFLKIDNLLDRDPSVVASFDLASLQTNPALYETLGRTYQAGIRFNY